MSAGDINKLIRDWRRDKKRRSRRDTFAKNPKEYQQFVATVASQYLPEVRTFITTKYSQRKKALKAWKHLVARLEEDMRMLDAFDPVGNTQFFAVILVAQGALHDKTAQKAFEQSKAEPVDSFGNPEFISSIVAALDTVFDQTYHAMRGMTGKDLRTSLVRRASQRLHNALLEGLVSDLQQASELLLPPLTVVEMQLEKFHIEKADSEK